MFERFNFVFPVDVLSRQRLCSDPLSAAIGAAATVIGSIIGGSASRQSSADALQGTREMNETNLAISRETNKANLDLYREQFGNSLKVMDAEQRWNSESEQVRRLRAAGINPALAFGESASVGSPSLPSAAPAEGATMQAAPYEAYSDSFVSGMLNSLPNIAQSIESFTRSHGQQIDNQTRDAYNRKQLQALQADIENKLMSSKLSQQQRENLQSQKQGIDLMNKLADAQYEDKIDMFKLQKKFQETQERVLNETNARDAARLAQDLLESDSRIRLNSAQQSNLYTMAKIAAAKDFRDSLTWQDEQVLRDLDKSLKRLQIDDASNAVVLRSIIGESTVEHLRRKDRSEINRIIERMYGFGFSDIAGAVSDLLGAGAKLK